MSDLIDREDAIRAVGEAWGKAYRVIDALKSIPSAERKGEWVGDCAFVDEFGQPYVVDRCNQCGYCGYADMNYCPNCGADMRPKLQGTHFDSIIIDECAMKGAEDE